jgi:hypothetical protein
MALRMKVIYENAKNAHALIANNYFFGNNPGENQVFGRNRKIDVVYELKSRIIASFTEHDAGEIFFRTFSYLLGLVKWGSTPLDDVEKFTSIYIKKFDDVARQCWQVQYSSGKDHRIIAVRKGSLPNRSSLLLKGEMKLVLLAISPFFESLDTIKLNWATLINTYGYTFVKEKLSKEFKRRHTILERFANVTTKRLQNIRRSDVTLKNIKKKDVNLEMLKRYLSSRTDPSKEFFEEVLAITGDKLHKIMYTYIEIKKNLLSGTGKDYFINDIISTYAEAEIYKNKSIPKLAKLQTDIEKVKYQDTLVQALTVFWPTLNLCQSYISKYSNQQTSENRGGYREKLISSLKAFQTHINSLLAFKEEDLKTMSINVFYIHPVLSNINLIELGKVISVFLTKVENTPTQKTLAKTDDSAFLDQFKQFYYSFVSCEVVKEETQYRSMD